MRCGVVVAVVWIAVVGYVAEAVLQYRDVFGTFTLDYCETSGSSECPMSIVIPEPSSFISNGGDVVFDIDLTEVEGLNCTKQETALTQSYTPGESGTETPGQCDNISHFEMHQFQNTTSRRIDTWVLVVESGQDSFNGSYSATPECFASSSAVRVRKGSVVELLTLAEVQVGDWVESFDSSGSLDFSEVFLIQHENDSRARGLIALDFITTSGAAGTLRVSKNHLLFDGQHQLFPAGLATVGSTLLSPEGSKRLEQAKIVRVHHVRAPVRNVHTMSDRVVVDGVAASSFNDISFKGISLANPIVLLPLKLLYRVGLRRLPQHIDGLLHRHLSHLVR